MPDAPPPWPALIFGFDRDAAWAAQRALGGEALFVFRDDVSDKEWAPYKIRVIAKTLGGDAFFVFRDDVSHQEWAP